MLSTNIISYKTELLKKSSENWSKGWIKLSLLLQVNELSGKSITMEMSYVKVLVARSCLTLCDPMDCSPPGSSAHGILEWVAILPSPGDLPKPSLLHCRQIFYHLSYQRGNELYSCLYSS